MDTESTFLTIYYRIVELLQAPINNPDMMWLVAPLLISVMLMTLYFGRYETEELGWNTAVGNSLILLFISLDLLRQIYNGEVSGILNPSFMNFEFQAIKTAIGLGLLMLAMILLLMNFTHAIPKRLSYFVSSALPINLTAYVAMTIIYSDVPTDYMTLIAALMLFFVLLGALQIIKLFERIYLKYTTKGEVTILPGTRIRQQKSKQIEELDKLIDTEIEKELKKTGKDSLSKKEIQNIKTKVKEESKD